MIPLTIQDQFYSIQKLQRSPIPQTSNWLGTFFAVSYSKPALVLATLQYFIQCSQFLFDLLLQIFILLVDPTTIFFLEDIMDIRDMARYVMIGFYSILQ